jgi:hypothetical protein
MKFIHSLIHFLYSIHTFNNTPIKFSFSFQLRFFFFRKLIYQIIFNNLNLFKLIFNEHLQKKNYIFELLKRKKNEI